MDYMRNSIRAVAAQFPPQTSYFLGYDEMRQMHTCDLCHRMFPTAGQLLTWHVGQAYQIIRSASVNTSNSRIMVWSGMYLNESNNHLFTLSMCAKVTEKRNELVVIDLCMFRYVRSISQRC
jgi:hypothetical protein